MAVLRNGINGAFSGKVGSVIGYEAYGKAIMRGLNRPLSKKKKKGTTKQQICRSGFVLMQDFLKPMLPFIRIGFNLEGRKRQMSAHNVAKSVNMLNALIDNQEIDYSKAVVTYGSLPGAEQPEIETCASGIRFRWSNKVTMPGADTRDQVMLLAYTQEKGRAHFSRSGARRKIGSYILEIPWRPANRIFHCWIAFISDDRQSISMSSYCGAITVEKDSDEVFPESQT